MNIQRIKRKQKEQLKQLEKFTPPRSPIIASKSFKDKSKYTRKTKHKKED
jgi:hypothetical protein